MVEFDGVELNDVAPVNVIDVIVSAPSVELVTQNIPLMDGAHFVRSKRGMRMVTVTFVLMEQDEEVRRGHIAKICAWASKKQLCTLRGTPEPCGHLRAICTQYPDQKSREFWDVLTLVFTAPDPRYIGCAEYVQDIADPVYIEREDDPAARIEQTVDATLTNPTWRLGDAYIKLTSVTPGALVIDLDRQSVTLNGESLGENVTLDSTFFQLQKGANQIECSNGAGGVVRFRERWV